MRKLRDKKLLVSFSVIGVKTYIFLTTTKKTAQFDCFKLSLHKYLFRWGILRDEGDLKVGAYQLPPKVILAAFSTDAFPHKVHLINYYLPW